MRIVVDRTRCAGMGICEGLAPERFQIQSDGQAHLLQDGLEDVGAREVAQEAVDMCPTEALRIVD